MKNIFLKFLLIVSISSIAHSQWNLVENFPPVEILTIEIFDEKIYAGSINKIYKSEDGFQWDSLELGASGEIPVSSLHKYENYILAGTFGSGVYLSDNNGASWQKINSGLVGQGSLTIMDFETRNDTIFAATNGASIFGVALNFSKTWFPYKKDIPTSISGNTETIYNFNDTLIAAAGGNGAVYLNYPNSNKWVERYFQGVVNHPVIMLDFHKVGSRLLGISTVGVYKSENSGVNWSQVQLPNSIGLIEEGRIIKKSETEYFINLVKPGASYLYSLDPSTLEMALLDFKSGDPVGAAVYFNNKIFGGTFFSGIVYKNFTPVKVPEKKDSPNNKYFEIAAYPNPFNPSTVINVDFSTASKGPLRVKAEAFNIIGQKIQTLFDGETNGEENLKLNFNGENLPGGVYLCRLLVEDSNRKIQTKTIKLSLVK